ncbi:MAG: hypothetical protein IJN80_06770 [Clostridia bacterium]|nr:hypothetical protein [Clostridia bacterium]
MNRRDGKRIKKVDPMYQIAAYVMNKRIDSMNMISLEIPLEPMLQFTRKKLREDGVKISRLAVVLAAYIRVLCEYPKLNHFIINSKPYARNELAVSMVVLKGGAMDDGGTMSKIYFQPTDDLYKVQERLSAYIEENRKEDPDNGTEKIMKVLMRAPGLLKVAVEFLRWLDKWGLLPKAVIDMSPFHASLLVTDLASIRTDAIYHHIYEFGSTSVAMAIGNSKEVARKSGDGVVFEKCMPLGLVMDERIASGSDFAMAFHAFRNYMKHPELLEQPPQKIHDEIKEIFHID